MVAVKTHLNLLGLLVKDRVTGYKGVVISVSFDLYGCIQAIVVPRDENEVKTGNWFDVTRLEVLDFTPVMSLPNFDMGYVAEGKKGAAPKPPM